MCILIQSFFHICRHFYELCQYLLYHRLPDLQECGSEFVCGFVQSMDGEKDPRNLVFAFDCVHIIARHMPLDMFAEELFEVVSCYFPIEFTPSPKDPGSITKEELVLSLRNCLIATPIFAEFCLPLLLEKTTSSVTSSKLDALDTLAAGASAFGARNLKEYMASFWAAIRREVFSNPSDAVIMSALNCLTAITKCLTEAVVESAGTSLLDEFITDALTDTKRYLSDPGQKLMIPCASLLEAAAKGSSVATNKILNLIIPILVETFHHNTQNNLRRQVLETMLVFISVGRTASEEQVGILAEKKDTLIGIFLSLLGSDTNFQQRILAIMGMIGLASMKGLLLVDECSVLATHLVNISTSDSCDAVIQEANRGLGCLGTHYPSLVLNEVIPALQEALEAENELPLNALACSSTDRSIINVTAPLLLKHLDKLNSQNVTSASNIASATCRNLLHVTETSSKQQVEDHEILTILALNTKLMIKGAMNPNDCVLNDCHTVQSLSTCARLMAQKLGNESAKQLAENLISVFCEGNVKSVEGIESNSPFRPLHVTSPIQQTRLIIHFSAVLCSLKCRLPAPVISNILDRMTNVTLLSPDCDVSVVACKCLAGLVNKMEPGQQLNEVLVVFKTKIEQDLGSQQTSGLTAQRSVLLLSWLTKALLLRSHPYQVNWIDQLLALLKHPNSDIAQTAADGFQILLNEYEDIMTPAMNADVKIMYRQRFFTFTLNHVVTGYQEADMEKRNNYLAALSYLLRFTPKQVLMPELPNLLPLLMQSLQCESPQLWLSTLETIKDLLLDTPVALTPHIDSLISHLLRLSQYKDSMRVRLSALKCFGLMTSLSQHLLLPHQHDVTKGLGKCVDDHKRLVRKEAVIARTEWFLLGAPGT